MTFDHATEFDVEKTAAIKLFQIERIESGERLSEFLHTEGFDLIIVGNPDEFTTLAIATKHALPVHIRMKNTSAESRVRFGADGFPYPGKENNWRIEIALPRSAHRIEHALFMAMVSMLQRHPAWSARETIVRPYREIVPLWDFAQTLKTQDNLLLESIHHHRDTLEIAIALKHPHDSGATCTRRIALHPSSHGTICASPSSIGESTTPSLPVTRMSNIATPYAHCRLTDIQVRSTPDIAALGLALEELEHNEPTGSRKTLEIELRGEGIVTTEKTSQPVRFVSVDKYLEQQAIRWIQNPAE